MSMRCSLIGHSYPDGEESRTTSNDTEAGDIEVVQQFQTCERCGHEKTVSENKSVRVPDADTSPEDPETESSTEQPEPLQHGYDLDTNDAIILDDGADIEPDETTTTPETEPQTIEDESDLENAKNGVVILPSNTTEADEEESEEPTKEASESGESDSTDGREFSSSAVILDSKEDEKDASKSTDEPVNSVRGESSEEADSPGASDNAIVWEGDSSSSAATQTESKQVTNSSKEDEASGEESNLSRARKRAKEMQQRVRSRRTGGQDVSCPDCSYREAQYEANLRAGDACPDCRLSYLQWVESDGGSDP